MKNEMEAGTKSHGQWRDFFQLLLDAKPPKALLVIVLLISLVETGAGLLVPWLTKDLVDVMTTANLDRTSIYYLVGAFLLQGVSSGVAYYLLSYIGQQVVSALRTRLWNKSLALRIPYYDQNRTGEIISRITNDTSLIRELITGHLISFFSSLVSIVGAVTILLFLDWQMTLVMLSSLPIIFLVIRPLGQRIYKVARGLQDEMATFTGLLTQVLTEIRLVKSSNAEPVERERGETGIRNLFAYGMKEARIQAVLAPLMTLVMMAMLVTIIGFGGVRVATGALTAGELVAFLLYLFRILLPLTQLAQFFTSLQKAMGATERLMTILRQEEEREDEGLPVPAAREAIRFEGVSFRYGAGEDVLHDVSFEVPPGKVTALVGPSGSGKTTIFSLVERYYEPSEGMIRRGEIPVQEFALAQWRGELGYVSQESPLMAGTIRDNICYGLSREVTEAELVRAAEMANAHAFISELPAQFDTEVGERGIKLSGGQRQRIAIARALLRNPHVLMLDEATSNLDSASERAVQDALNNLMAGRTTLVIAHRLSTVVKADQILVVEKGRITGAGTHEELYEGHALYRELADQQFGTSEE